MSRPRGPAGVALLGLALLACTPTAAPPLQRVPPGSLVAHHGASLSAILPGENQFQPFQPAITGSLTAFGAEGAWQVGCERFSAAGWRAKAPVEGECLVSDDGQWLVTRDTDAGESRGLLTPMVAGAEVPLGPVAEVALWPKPGFLVVLRPNGAVQVLDGQARVLSEAASAGGPPRAGLLVDPAARWIGFVEAGSGWVLVDRAGGQRRVVWPAERGPLRAPTASRDGASIVAIDPANAVVSVDSRTGDVRVVRPADARAVAVGPIAVGEGDAIAVGVAVAGCADACAVWRTAAAPALVLVADRARVTHLHWVR